MVAKAYGSKKQKGSKYEKEIAAMYVKYLDIPAKRMPLSGAVSYMKGDIFKDGQDRDWVDECKNQESLKIWEFLKQAEDQVVGTDAKPLLHFKRNHSKSYTVIQTEHFFELRAYIKEIEEELEELQWRMDGLEK